MTTASSARPARPFLRPCGLFLLACVLLWGCARPTPPPPPPPPPPAKVEPVTLAPLSTEQALAHVREMHPSTQGLKSWRELEPGLRASLAYVSARPSGAVAVNRSDIRVTWGMLRQTLEDLLGALPYLDEDPALLARVFAWFPVLEKPTLATGYYEPFLEASLVPHKDYPYAIYGQPHDMLVADLGDFHPRWKGQKLHYRVTKNGIKPYHGRGEIDFDGVLREKGAEIAWVKDRVELYFLHIQGSGRLILPDGSIKHVLFANKNGRELSMLGRTVIKRGHLTRDEASKPRISKFMQDNPHLERELLSADQSYVFFRLADEGPFGSMGKLLTPLSSIAVDRALIPLGAVLTMNVPLPVPSSGGPSRLGGIMMAQDTGGAIVGNHIDLFCGSGPYADFVSGRMKNPATLHLMLSQRALGDLRLNGANGNGANGNGLNGNGNGVPLHGQNGNGNGNGTPAETTAP